MSQSISFSELMRQQGLEPGIQCCAAQTLSGLTGLALFIIGCVGAAGAFPGATIGWVTVGLAGGSLLFTLAAGGDFKQRMWTLIPVILATAAWITVGALGGAGVLSATQVGWGILGTSAGSCLLSCIASRVQACVLSDRR